MKLKIVDIAARFRTLVADDWYVTNPDEWSTMLEGLYEGHAQGDEDALITFLDFAAGDKGEDYAWSPEKFERVFEKAYKTCAPTASAAIREYFRYHEEETDSHALAEDVNSSKLADYTDWESYVKDQRPDLFVMERSGMTYIFC